MSAARVLVAAAVVLLLSNRKSIGITSKLSNCATKFDVYCLQSACWQCIDLCKEAHP